MATALERRSFAHVDPKRGRFRSFLLAALNYYLADAHDRAAAQKRGGGRPVLAFDGQLAEQRYRMEPLDERSPDRLFERRWALTLLEQVLTNLEREFREAGKEALFQHLSPFLVAGGEQRSRPGAAA